ASDQLGVSQAPGECSHPNPPVHEVSISCIIVRMGCQVASAGAGGCAGGELLRLVVGHPDLDVGAVTANGNAGQRVGDVHPQLRSLADRVFVGTTPAELARADLV